MKLIVGLGNSGRRYDGTRHNIGFDVVDLVASRQRIEWESGPRGIEALVARWRAADVVVAKPLTFMNLSGVAVVGLLQFYKIDPADMLVVVDDVNIELGRLRTRARGSAGGHNGLKSIAGSVGSDEFARLRVGVGRGDDRRDLADHVLSKFDASERVIVVETVDRSADAVELFVAEGIGPVMNRYNKKEDAE
ncbi:MAG: aminoacyl-tRNA hydrolase [Acidobacteria bacterium]|nr:aminoacyl-tRNA hydrolase [Acidobacteriota bacterium]